MMVGTLVGYHLVRTERTNIYGDFRQEPFYNDITLKRTKVI